MALFPGAGRMVAVRSEEHTSELQHVEISYAVFCLKKKKRPAATATTHCNPNAAVTPIQTGTGGCRVVSRSVATNVLSGSSTGTMRTNFFFNDTATTEIYTLSLHDALPI